jgi:hypothetical protein
MTTPPMSSRTAAGTRPWPLPQARIPAALAPAARHSARRRRTAQSSGSTGASAGTEPASTTHGSRRVSTGPTVADYPSTVTTPSCPSTRMRRPVLMVATALPVPITAGRPYSRQMMAVWLMIRVGLRAPAHLTGCGKAALALLPPTEVAARVEAVCAAESRHLPDLAALARELDRARRAGFVVSDTFQPGRTSVAAPIPDPAGAPAGGISVAGPTPLLAARLDRIRDQVVAAAGLIGRRLRTGTGP